MARRAARRCVKLLADLLNVEGWTQDRWERLEANSARQLAEVFDIDGNSALEEVGTLLAYAKSRDLDLSKRKAADAIVWATC